MAAWAACPKVVANLPLAVDRLATLRGRLSRPVYGLLVRLGSLVCPGVLDPSRSLVRVGVRASGSGKPPVATGPGRDPTKRRRIADAGYVALRDRCRSDDLLATTQERKNRKNLILQCMMEGEERSRSVRTRRG